ncbi:helicase HerA-like domain-containing protein [Labrenzia sp. OB1]|uniref:helicase HerA-like domain-containing protein n=1 Tax=Labrenzia sp. OB1 TaxID=1561204 RepID=UPI0007B23EA5|nr:helicase HerA-like domain-containing protein [Labrenzia sp. OB1]KZM49254.1 ATP-binding protein [Labrenzia sp. OB1]
MTAKDNIFIGASTKTENLALKLANRHGLIAGATGTGKTVSLQILAEGFSKAGVPVFCADIKGDLSGLAAEGVSKDFLEKRAQEVGLEKTYSYKAFPAVFWDLFGEQGHPIRTTVSEIGPLLLARLLELNDTQEGVLNILFELADDEGLLLLDLKDLRAMLAHVAERASELSTLYGNVSKASIGAIQRRLLVLERQGGENFFGEPALDIRDLIRTAPDGRGVVNILAADKLMTSPRLYGVFLLWLLSELFEELPEIGDPEKPKLVFFFDEAHLLFTDAPKALIEKVEQVVRLIRSKGVGVYFVTQNPLDVPETVLSQLGNRIQHALRAFTPRDQKAVRAAAETFRPNPDLDTERVITELGVGEALVSTLEGKGIPSVVQRTLIRPPSSRLGPITKAERRTLIQSGPVFGIYDRTKDRKSAYEILTGRAEETQRQEERRRQKEDNQARKHGEPRRTRSGFQLPDFGRDDRPRRDSVQRRSNRRSQRDNVLEAGLKSAARSLGTSLGRALVRGLLGSLKRGN